MNIPNPKFQVVFGKNGEYYFQLRAENGEIILKSNAYPTQLECVVGIDHVKNNAQNESGYTIRTTANGQYYFTFGTYGAIGTSETYTSRVVMEKALETVRYIAPNAAVENYTIE